jgi:hypothetical protein
MKTAEQMIMESIDLHYLGYSQGEVEDIALLMRKFAYQAVNEAAKRGEAQVEWIGEPPITNVTPDEDGTWLEAESSYVYEGDLRTVVEGYDYEVAIIRDSIYQIKDEIK